MNIAAYSSLPPASVASAYQTASAYQSSYPYATAASTQAVAAPAYAQDQYVPSGYLATGPNDNVVYGQAKNVGLRVLNRQLNLKSSYLEAAFVDKTPQDAMDIENVDFNLYVHSGEVAVSDVDATLTVDEILRRKQARSGKAVPVSDLRVAFGPDNQIRVEGKYKALGMSIPFSVAGNVAVDTAGQIRYSLGQTKVAGLRVDGLMKTFGLSLDKLLSLHNPNDGYYTEGNTLVVDLGRTVSQMDGAPGLNATIRGVRTHLGNIELLMGDSPEDAQRALSEKQIQEPSYVKAEDGHAYIDGFFVKDSKIAIYDRTPDTPLNINAKGDIPERSIQLHEGYVGVTEQRFAELLRDEVGGGQDLTDLYTELTPKTAKVSGLLFGKIPLALNMTFSPTADGRLMFTPSHAKAYGFIPLPGGLVKGQLQKVVKSGEPYGDGVALGLMNGMDLGYVQNVYHQDGYMVLKSGPKPSQP